MITASKIDEHIQGFYNWLGRGDMYSPATVREYSNTARNFLITNPWGDEYKYNDIVDYFGRLASTTPSVNRRKNKLIHLRRYYDYLVQSGYRKDHPCGRFKLQGKSNKGVIHSDLFTMGELESIISRTDGWGQHPARNKLLYSLLIYQALTTEELVDLKINDVDLDKGVIHIRKHRLQYSRELLLNPRQYELFHQYLKKRKGRMQMKTDALFLTFFGLPAENQCIRNSVKLLEGLFPGKKFCQKKIRVSIIAHWLNVLKLPVEQVQLLAGCRCIGNLEKYIYSSTEEQQKTLKSFHPMG